MPVFVCQDYSVEMFLTEEWYDERLHFSNSTDSERLEVDSKMMDNVWVPDVFFRNEKEGNFHEVTVPNKYMHLKPSGHVIYSMRSASAGPLGVGWGTVGRVWVGINY